jgi:4-hydroxy-tetrahydrodipicolinate synthase
VKFAASLLKLSTEDVRLPLIPCSDAAREKIRAAMKQAELV